MPPRHAKAIAHLRAVDPKLGAWIDAAGPCGWQRRGEGTHFEHIARAIVYQQLSTAAATTIYGRFLDLYGGAPPTPRQVRRTPEARLRGVGLSGQKTRYILDLARHADAGSLPLDELESMDDAAVIEALSQVKGIGEWTAQMVLMFRLGRPDVLPALDLGIQKAIKLVHGLRTHPEPKRVARIGACWAPYRTIASWYLWRRVDAPPA